MNLAHKIEQSEFNVELEQRVKNMYRAVALYPESDFHFEMGRKMAERLGYESSELNRIPQESVESFAGVGHYFDLANLQKNDLVVDLGSGSGMDSFIASNKVGFYGNVIGIDMTDEQRNKANYLRDNSNFCNVSYKKAYIDDTGLPGSLYHAVISNGVINLAADKLAVFKEAYRILRPGGKLALSDIVTEKPLPEGITCDVTLWAACIGGAMQQDDYINAIRQAGFRMVEVRDNPEYHFISEGAARATENFGVKSISVLAIKD